MSTIDNEVEQKTVEQIDRVADLVEGLFTTFDNLRDKLRPISGLDKEYDEKYYSRNPTDEYINKLHEKYSEEDAMVGFLLNIGDELTLLSNDLNGYIDNISVP